MSLIGLLAVIYKSHNRQVDIPQMLTVAVVLFSNHILQIRLKGHLVHAKSIYSHK